MFPGEVKRTSGRMLQRSPKVGHRGIQQCSVKCRGLKRYVAPLPVRLQQPIKKESIFDRTYAETGFLNERMPFEPTICV